MSKVKNLGDASKELGKVLEVQAAPGNWDYDPYMHGMYNGMELAMSILQNREPNFRQAPKVWLSDKKHKGQLKG